MSMLRRGVGLLLIVVGLLFLLNIPLYLFPGITLIVDSTGPSINPIYPQDGKVYSSISQFECYVSDAESGVQSVTLTIDSQTFTMIMGTGRDNSIYGAYWYYTPSSAYNSPGTHSFTFKATNYAGLSTTVSGSFTIYSDLKGDFYVNDVKITSASQVIYATSRTVNFKFVKTGGSASPNQITVTVEWSGPATGRQTLPYTATDTWSGSVTFTADGKYTVTLTANDGVKTITMSIVGLQIGESYNLPTFGFYQWLGALMILLGLVITIRSRMRG